MISIRARTAGSFRRALHSLRNPGLLQTQGFINGQWVTGASQFTVLNPATGQELAQVACMTDLNVESAIDAATQAFTTYKHTTARMRSDFLYRLYQLMTENAEDLARILTLENGKTLVDARGEVAYAASFYKWFAEEAPRMYGDTIPSANGDNRILTMRQPVGVVGILTPWNFPQAMFARKVAAALAAGCTSVIKPDSEVPLSALAFARLVEEAGIPPGVVNVVPVSHERTPAAGKIICEHPDVRKVSFTGSTPVGALLMAQSAGTVKKVSMELGGNAPFIVFDDADIDAAVAGAIGSKFRQSGQTCVCANRLYIQEGIYEEFAKKFTQAVEKLKLGNGLDPDVSHGPLIHTRAVKKVQEHIADAVAKQGTVLTGGSGVPELGANFFQLTVVRDATADMKVALEETFGPLAALFKFKTEEEAVRLANATEFGLAGYLFSRDYARVFRVGEALEVGMVGANTGAISESALPFGGVKASGLGREGSKYGIDDYTVVKSIVIGGINQR
ncbi:hypothetical protein BABINDRAFT_160215 [Babjeviella inositovora NRRL Y-12698]|uniref:Succinate-semialdehyde dehydrogenase n=1 Tax=Babjeviella inositovora NRRL Y-12698 TaxID=984486 RepID=A0A1E3QWE2_9ASCO|nr:uncharacterized protein BABINDRAFT_160215 [Babjeviella inositovora NRRL Y-12698]ODQ82003.1 hypothetical protein BABINDRAFT_160215 [Babjeviella inositovora NRRL Y-12698]